VDYQLEKEKLLNTINIIESEQWEENYLNIIVGNFLNLKNVIVNDFFTVVVLGEFKRGKSTFVNSLLETELLPSNVTPTTATINAIMYNDEKKAEVTFHNGSIKSGEATLEFLEEFTAEAPTDTNAINYIKVGYPSELLSNNVILVDTPGVSDINQQRVQVTYDFIPKADVIIFLIDATSPIKRTEKEFIEEHLLKVGIEKVIFIANRFDEIEEEDEQDVLEDIKKRLTAALKGTDLTEIQVIPYSAYLALQGVLKKDQGLISQSNLPLVKEKIQTLISNGSSPENRLKSYTRKLCLGLNAIDRKLNQDMSILRANAEELQIVVDKMNAFKLQEKSRSGKIHDYAEIQKRDMLAMIRKSMQFFQTQLKEEVTESVDSYRGTEFKSYIEKQIVSLIQKRISQWVYSYSVSMNQMLAKVNHEIATGLARHFNSAIAVSSNSQVTTEFNRTTIKIDIEADDISNVTTQAGLIVGGAAGLLALIGGPLLLPIVGLAGYPFLQKNMLDQKLRVAKDKIIPELVNLINQTFNTLYGEIEKNISNSISQIIDLNEQKFHEIFDTFLIKVESEIENKKSNKEELLKEETVLHQRNKLVNRLLHELKGEM
jgi:small GTP-binding protein